MHKALYQYSLLHGDHKFCIKLQKVQSMRKAGTQRFWPFCWIQALYLAYTFSLLFNSPHHLRRLLRNLHLYLRQPRL